MAGDKSDKVRVRFPPSPTGLLHIGNVRTALFNWLFAKGHNGQFILRIEDTDKERSRPEFEENIKSGLKWLGLNWDEFYKQSERIDIYKKYLEQLLQENKAYYCFCSKEDLEAEKQALMSQGIQPKYSGKCGNLRKDEIKERLERKDSYVLRFRVQNTILSIKDIIRGTVKFDTSLIGDLIIARNLDEPLYNFAVVVDDALMEITHVIRGEEHLSNTPRQVLIAQALGFTSPQFAHLPLILNPDRSKMSKRFSDTALKDYISSGYLKEAMINFLGYLGWHPREDKEIMSLEELANEFDLGRVQKGGAIFNPEKLNWLNGYYLNKLDISEFIEIAKQFIPSHWHLTEPIVASVKGRIKKFSEFKELVDFYFELPNYDKELLKWKDLELVKIVDSLKKTLLFIENTEPDEFSAEHLEEGLNNLTESGKRGELFWPVRVALSGKSASPGPGEIMEALGKEETLKKIKFAIEKCGS